MTPADIIAPVMGTDLYERTLAFDYEDDERADLMKMVWSVTPWMIDCFTGNINSERELTMREWLYSHIGEQAHPIHGRDGEWQLGSAVIHGWTWLGFRTEDQLPTFKAAFPDWGKDVSK